MIIGVDPGPNGFAWAKLVDYRNGAHCGRLTFVDWGEHDFRDGHTVLGNLQGRIYAIEEFTPGRILGGHSRDTIKTIGRLMEWWPYPNHILIPRIRVAACFGLAANRKRGDTVINRCMANFYPELKGRQPGLNSHTRAACAVAHCAIGMLQAERIKENVK